MITKRGGQRYRYYATQRPPMLGSIPRGAFDVVCFDDRIFVAEIGRQAWGYAVYDHKLSRQDVDNYELVEYDG